MLVKRSDITDIQLSQNSRDGICIIIDLVAGYIILPCAPWSMVNIGDHPDLDRQQLQLAQALIDAHEPDEYVELTPSILHNMEVYQ